jgi:thymidylate synthase
MSKNNFEKDYKKLLVDVSCNGIIKQTRTGIDAISAFNKSLTIDLTQGFPILTSRKIFFHKGYHEYMWIREGLTTTTYLHNHGIKWWDDYADDKGNLGKTYGYQLRSFNGEIDQMDYAHRSIRMKSRQGHITFWNPSEIHQTPLPPCFTGMTPMVIGDTLNLSVQFRSSDLMLGLPYDIIMFALFLIELAEFNELKPHKLGIQITDAHIYKNHDYQSHDYIHSKIHKLPIIVKSKTNGYDLIDYKHERHIEIPLNK